MQRRRHHLAGG